MVHTYKIDGMTCNGCKATVERTLSSLPEITEVEVKLENGTAEVEMIKHLEVSVLREALPDKYSISEIGKKSPPASQTTFARQEEQSKWEQLKPLFLILGYISVASVLRHYTDWDMKEVMLDFMGLFFIVFSFFKMLDLKGFPDSFRMYDPLAKRVPVYAKIYPFIETALGLMFLMRFEIFIALALTIIILGITTMGVSKTLLDKKSIRCACLGTALKLPMTEATFIENAIMLVMSTILLFNLI